MWGGETKAPQRCPAPFQHHPGQRVQGKMGLKGSGPVCPECLVPSGSAGAGSEGEDATDREDGVTWADGLERGRRAVIPVDAAVGRTQALPSPDIPIELSALGSLAGVSQLLICGRSDLLYFRSHEVNLHCSSRELLRRFGCDFLPAVTVGRNTTEMMRSEDSFLDRKEAHGLSLGPAQAGSNQTGRA